MKFAAEKIDAALKFAKSTDTQKIPVLFSGGIAQNKMKTVFPLIQKHLLFKNAELKILSAEQVDGAIRKAKEISKGANP